MSALSIVQYMIGHYGGAERFFVRLCVALKQRGIRQHLIINDDPQFVSLVQRHDLPYTIIKTRRFFGFLDSFAVAKICKAQNANVILAWMSRAARRLPRGRIARIGRLGGWYPVRHYRKCDHLIGNSPSVLDFILQSGWPAERASLISNFAHLTPSNKLTRAMVGIKPEQFVILAMGRFHPSKGFDQLIRAIAPLPHVHVLLAGQGNEDVSLKSLATELGVAGRIHFLGWRDDIADLYALADVFVIPSREEPLGNVVLEAWSMQVPVISSDSEGPGWLVENGQTGLIYPKDDYHALTDAIRSVSADPDLRQALKDKAYRKWKENFSEDAICSAYINLVEQVLSRKN